MAFLRSLLLTFLATLAALGGLLGHSEPQEPPAEGSRIEQPPSRYGGHVEPMG